MVHSDDIKRGDRLVFPEGFDIFPLVNVTAHLTGTVTEIDYAGSMAYVRLDQHISELADWDNVLQVPFDDDGNLFFDARFAK